MPTLTDSTSPAVTVANLSNVAVAEAYADMDCYQADTCQTSNQALACAYADMLDDGISFAAAGWQPGK